MKKINKVKTMIIILVLINKTINVHLENLFPTCTIMERMNEIQRKDYISLKQALKTEIIGEGDD